VELVPGRPNVELGRSPSGEPVAVFAFPYDARLVDAMRRIPGRRFDWVEREWSVPQNDLTAVYVADVLARWPSLVASDEVREWLARAPAGWVGRVGTAKTGGEGVFAVRTMAGTLPDGLAEVMPLTEEVAERLSAEKGAKPDRSAALVIQRLLAGLDVPGAMLAVEHSVAEARLSLDVLWDADAAKAFIALPGADVRSSSLPVDPWVVEPLEGFLRAHGVAVSSTAEPVLRDLRTEHDAAIEAIRRSRGHEAPPLELALHGELAPFQWAGVRYVLDARRAFLADEQGLGKTVQALAALEADGAFPAIVVCPASLKLNWEREAARWLPHRTRTLVSGRGTVPAHADLVIVNYDIVGDHRDALMRLRPRALVLDESHYVKNPRAKRTRAVRRLSTSLAPDALRLALTGTPVLNHADELIAQLRILGRLEEFGSGARFSRRFQGSDSEERLHWHLRRTCFVRRLKKEVLPQLPDKRQVVIPVALDNEEEYRLAQRDVIEWLRAQPLDLRELDAKIAAALRAERLAQLNTLKRLAARGKLAAAVTWIHDFLESGEPLVVFSHHAEVQEALFNRFPFAATLLGRDSQIRREETVREFQDGEHQLLIASTLVAGQGITLTHASNVAFLELEWTPALHDQAEDRCHRIGQHDAVTAWYLLAAGTIDETIAELLQRKRRTVDAVTDGRSADTETLVDAVVKSLRAAPIRHLRAVG
jgi:superfamily II DNA or RNA helicase